MIASLLALAVWGSSVVAEDFEAAHGELARVGVARPVAARLGALAKSHPGWARWFRVWNDTFEVPPVDKDCAADLVDATFYRRRTLVKALTIMSWSKPGVPPPAGAARNLGVFVGLAMHHASTIDLEGMDRVLEAWVEQLRALPPGIDLDGVLAREASMRPFLAWRASLGPLGKAVWPDEILR